MYLLKVVFKGHICSGAVCSLMMDYFCRKIIWRENDEAEAKLMLELFHRRSVSLICI